MDSGAPVFGVHADAVAVLLDAGADPDRRQPGGATARRFARDPRVIEVLARTGAK